MMHYQIKNNRKMEVKFQRVIDVWERRKYRFRKMHKSKIDFYADKLAEKSLFFASFIMLVAK